MAHQQVHRGAGHLHDGLAHRGQLGPDGGRQRRVVEADDGQVAGHVQAHAVGDGHGGGGHVVVAGEDGRGPALLGQQRLGGVQARAVGEHALGHDLLLLDVEAGIGHRRVEAGETTRTAALAGVADDVAQAVVAQAHQMPRHLVGRLVVVDAHRAHAFGRRAAGHDDGRGVRVGHQLEQRLRITERRRQDQAVDAVGNHFGGGLFIAHASGLAALHHQLHMPERGLVQQADQEFTQIAGARVDIQHADADGL
mmetsp:Transcript_15034/g.35522  ORF Transcript_15034/g.35522 Transcript_15034/m.35522 type:complete len:252 (+) Transcript_15034:2216-2971(+)